jgi:hypothetical protein
MEKQRYACNKEPKTQNTKPRKEKAKKKSRIPIAT